MEVELMMAEALAATHALIMGRELGQNAIFEGDALQIITAVNLQKGCSCSYGHFVEDIQTGKQVYNC